MSNDGLLFVYGTLRRDAGSRNYQLLERHAEFFDHGTMRGHLFDLGSYPCAVASADSPDKVRGELFILRRPGHALRVLDEFEGVPGSRQDDMAQYQREDVTIRSHRHGRLRAWTYLYRFATGDLPVIVSGDYVRYMREQRTGMATWA